MDSIAFDYGPEEEEWKSVDGGTNLLTEAMIDMLKRKPIYNKRVTRIALDRSREGENKMTVITNYDEAPMYYTSVINTTTLACLQRIDTTDLELSPTIKIANRTLHYDSSTKAAIKFNHPWWITKCGIKSGGVANTDLPIRVWLDGTPLVHHMSSDMLTIRAAFIHLTTSMTTRSNLLCYCAHILYVISCEMPNPY